MEPIKTSQRVCRKPWSVLQMIEAGVYYYQTYHIMPFKSKCHPEFGLPSIHWIYRYIGTMPQYCACIRQALDGESLTNIIKNLQPPIRKPKKKPKTSHTDIPIDIEPKPERVYTHCLRCDKPSKGLSTSRRLCHDCRYTVQHESSLLDMNQISLKDVLLHKTPY